MQHIKKEIQEWIDAEERAGRDIDDIRLNQFLMLLMKRHNCTPRDDFSGLSPEQMFSIMYHPFGDKCVVELNKLEKEQYEKIPLVRQALFLLNALGEKEIKLTRLGWLPSKMVAETYHLGQPEWIVEEYGAKRYFEYDVKSVWMARAILDLKGWIKTRKGMLSLTVKGKKALVEIDATANEILRSSLVEVGLHFFDGVYDYLIGNVGLAYSVWLLNKSGSEWHPGNFYENKYRKVLNFPAVNSIYETRVFKHLFYWLGIVERRLNQQVGPPYIEEYRKTDLLALIFSFNGV